MENVKATMNHLELPPTASQVTHDETPTTLAIMAIYLLIDIYNSKKLGMIIYTDLELELGDEPSSKTIEQVKLQKNKPQLNQISQWDLLMSKTAPTTAILETIHATLKFLQVHFPHEIQSQLLLSKLHSLPSSLNLVETFRVFKQMSVKQIQWDTLSHLSPTTQTLVPFDPKIATIIAKHVLDFHSDFATSDSGSYEGAFKQDQSYQTVNMNGLSQRLLFSSSFFSSFFTLAITQSCLVNPVKSYYDAVLDQQYDNEYELIDPVEEMEKITAKEEREREQAQKKSQNSNQTAATAAAGAKTAATAPKTAAEKKAAIAAAQKNAKMAKAKKDEGQKNGGQNDQKVEKKIYDCEPKINPKLPIHLQHLQLVNCKHYESMSARGIHEELLQMFVDLFVTIKTTPHGRYLPTTLPHRTNPSQLNVTISSPSTLPELMLFVSNRQTNDDLTPLKPPSLIHTTTTSMTISSDITLANTHSIASTVIPKSNIHQNTPQTPFLLHPLITTPFSHYLPLGSTTLTAPHPTLVQRDVETSNRLINEYYFQGDEGSLMTRIKSLHTIILLLVTSPSLYTPTTSTSHHGINIDSNVSGVVEDVFDIDVVCKRENDKNDQKDQKINKKPELMHFSSLKSSVEKMTYLATLNNGVPIPAWIDTYRQSIQQYYSMAMRHISDQFWDCEGQWMMIQVELGIWDLVFEAFDLLSKITTVCTETDAIKQFTVNIFTKIKGLFSKMNDIVNEVVEESTPTSTTTFTHAMSLITTYLSPLLLLLTQRYDLKSYNNDDLSVGWVKLIKIYVKWHQIEQSKLSSTFQQNEPQNQQKLSQIIDPYLLTTSTPSSTPNSSLPPLPIEIQQQCQYVTAEKIWDQQYNFETTLSLLQTFHAAIYTPSDYESSPQLPIGAVDRRKSAKKADNKVVAEKTTFSKWNGCTFALTMMLFNSLPTMCGRMIPVVAGVGEGVIVAVVAAVGAGFFAAAAAAAAACCWFF
jgi:hypothetical protein